jgi:hypothetical protein
VRSPAARNRLRPARFFYLPLDILVTTRAEVATRTKPSAVLAMAGASKTGEGPKLVHSYPSQTRRHPISRSRPVFGGPCGLRRYDLVRYHLASDGDLCRAILVAHVCDHRWVSSLLLTSDLFDKPVVSIFPCIPRAKHRAKKCAVVGRETSASSLALGYRTGCAFTQA